MSDQNVVTDWKAHFASLGEGEPFSAERLEAMRGKDPKVALILDDRPGQLMSRHVLADEDCLSRALELWEAAGKPRAWMTRGEGSPLPWRCDAAASAKGKR